MPTDDADLHDYCRRHFCQGDVPTYRPDQIASVCLGVDGRWELVRLGSGRDLHHLTHGDEIAALQLLYETLGQEPQAWACWTAGPPAVLTAVGHLTPGIN